MAIYDCFMFHNEFELLKLRFEELYDKVDYFVLIEGDKTPSGKDKELYFENNKEKYSKYLDKVKHVVLRDMPTPADFGGDRWQIEFFNRNQLIRGLTECNDDDLILLSDVDEIPNPEKISEAINLMKKNEVIGFRQRFFYYYLNGHIDDNWTGTLMCSYKTLKARFNSEFQKLRDFRHAPDIPDIKGNILAKFRQIIHNMKNKSKYLKRVENGGWHFTYLGGTEKILQKIRSFCDPQFDTEDVKDKEKMMKRIESGADIFGRDQKVTYIPMDSTFPKTLLNNLPEYSHLIKKV